MKTRKNSAMLELLWKHGKPVYADELEGKFKVEWWFKHHYKEIENGRGVNVIRLFGREWHVLKFSVMCFSLPNVRPRLIILFYDRYHITDDLRRVVVINAHTVKVGIIGKLFWRGKFRGYFFMTRVVNKNDNT